MNIIKNLTVLVAATGLMAFSSAADDRSDLRAWAQDAGKEISSKMTYPKIAERQGFTGSTSYIVTINREGDVLSYEATGERSKATFGSASRRALKRVDFPDLPDSYDYDDLTFTLSLDYKSRSDVDHHSFKRRGGSVSGTRIAFLPRNVPVAAK